ncbi:large conductance mechanosensitive channel protein MscL [Spirochaeta lutea]|uniref:large conductance mechanosensitive channel protein MscL n=1 Tax=Spirochaeta lutea TaxID=1480694 RepID=UPI00068A9DE7|nr:large conductance mechanosensitive channel protein MscL [Spirochaeta lutea]
MRFREFIKRGNVVDLAVAVIMGGAFGKIVNSLVNDIIMPGVGVLLGGVDVSSLSITLGAVVLNYGSFIQSVIDFFIIALVIFIAVRTRDSLAEGFKEGWQPKKPGGIPEPPSNQGTPEGPASERAGEPDSTKTCPYCQSVIHIKALRCPHCTTVLKKRSSAPGGRVELT